MCSYLLIFPFTVQAQANDTALYYTEKEELSNGDYIITVLEEFSDSITRASSSKTGSKTVNYYNASGEKLWSFTLTASFSYNGSSASCTTTTCSYNMYSSAWKKESASTQKSGSNATCTFTAGKYALGVRINSITKTISMTCSKNGTIS